MGKLAALALSTSCYILLIAQQKFLYRELELMHGSKTFIGRKILNRFGQTNPRLRMQSRMLRTMVLIPGRSPAAARPPRLKSRVGRERK